MLIRRLPGRRWQHRAVRFRGVSDKDLLDTLEYYANSISSMAAGVRCCPRFLTREFTLRRLRRPLPDKSRRRLAGVSTAELRRVLVLNHSNIRPLAEMYGVCPFTIRMELNRRGIRTKGGVRCVSWSREVLHRMYVVEGQSQWQIARRYGVTQKTVSTHMHQLGVAARPFIDPRYGGGPRKKSA